MVIGSTMNGNCSLAATSVAHHKWKSRKVSAIRHFPPGCGPINYSVNTVPEVVEASQKVPEIVEACQNVPEIVEASQKVPEIVEASQKVPEIVEASQKVHEVVEAFQKVPELVEASQQVHEVVEPSQDAATDAVTDDGGGIVNAVVQVDNGKLMSTINDVKEPARKTFPKRRVSAVRHFPPFCGLNAPEPTEEERIRINGKRKCEKFEDKNGGNDVRLNELNVSDSGNEFLAKQKVGEEAKVEVEDGKIEKVETRTKVHNIGQACQALVVYARDHKLKRKCSDDEDSEDEKLKNTKKKDVKNIVDNRVGYEKSIKKRKDIGIKGKRSQDFTTPKQRNEMVAYGGTNEMVVREKDDDDEFVVDSEERERKNKEKVVREKFKSNVNVKRSPALMTAKKSVKRKRNDQEKVVREKLKSNVNVPYTGSLEMVVRDEDDLNADTEGQQDFANSKRKQDFDISLPPFGPKSSNDARNKVREVLRYFQGLCRKILQGEEAKNNEMTSATAPVKRVDLAAKAEIDKRGKGLKLGKKTYGPVPGVEVGDEFQYRVELALVGIHRLFQGGIDYVKQGKDIIAVSVVASGGYDNETDKPDCLTYSGAGGVAKDKSFVNQTLERGNLALKNSMDLKIPVRVIRGFKASSDLKSKMMTTYIYDGLYTVDDMCQVPGPHGNIVFKFQLKRIPGQPELAFREVKSKKFKTRVGVCEIDISNGKEVFPISAINTIDDEKPPVFTYITKIMYPEWYRPVPPKGCDCTGRCSNKKCACAFKNGGEIPYNRNGAIVESKPLVYECGPGCKCSPTCYNRVTQHGMKIHLEIFKTETRGWGVRSLSSISSGTFICEYIGELLEDTEAEKRMGNDEYLFDIGQNYTDCSVTPDPKYTDSGGFTIDAGNYGNVGRFINHSCSPNLYAQNTLYDQEDKRMPHIMFFAAENIPPLQELTYHYNYTVDTVHDSDGNIKVKNCYCGSSECRGRLY